MALQNPGLKWEGERGKRADTFRTALIPFMVPIFRIQHCTDS